MPDKFIVWPEKRVAIMFMREAEILPALKDVNWEFADKALCRVLVNEFDSPHLPWIAFGYDHPHTFEFVRESINNQSLDFEQLIMLEHEAIENLRRRHMTWQEIHYDLEGGNVLSFLVCDDDYLSAERVIDVEFMLQAHDLMGADNLLIGIPRRGILLAMRADENMQTKQAFADFVRIQYAGRESAPITPMVFTMDNGIIDGYFEAIEKPISVIDKELEEDQIFINVVHIDNDSDMTNGYYIFAGGKNMQKLARSIQESFVNIHRQQLDYEDDEIVYRIVPIPGMVPDSPEFKSGLTQLEWHLQSLSEELNDMYDLPPTKIEMIWGVAG